MKVVAERTTANATCDPLQCILNWEIVRKVKRASFPCVAFFPCRLHMICMVKGQEDTRNVLVEPNRVSWLKRHFARIRYGPRSGTGRIPFCRRAAWYGRCVHPTSTLWRSNCLLGSGSGAPNGLVCYSANRRSAGQFGTPELLNANSVGI